MTSKDMKPQEGVFLGRQPILNVHQEIVAYELLFRSADIGKSDYCCQDYASVSVIESALAGFGLREVLGDKDGFINITEEVLLSDMVEILPQGQAVLELLESVHFNEKTRKRALELKALGFRLALDDHVYSPQHSGMYQSVDVVKINILETPAAMLPEIAREIRKFPPTLLAECVETREQFRDCLAMGFELFQGYFFERPEILRRKGLESPKIAMLKLLSRLQGEMVIEEIEAVFHSHPELFYSMLKLVNSVHNNLREKIKSIRHAIMILGLDRLRRWAQLALYVSSDSRGIDNPLLEMAAVRGRLMEYLVMQRHSLPRGAELVEAAYMSGILSLLDVLLEIPMEEIVRESSLSDVVAASLLNREGELGDLLALAETLEMVNFGEVQRLVEATDIPLSDLLKAQLAAYNWRAGMALSGEQ